MPTLPTEKQLLDAACHFGHPKEKWNPKMKQYLYGVRSGVHIFDLSKTATQLNIVAEHMKALQAQGKSVLFVSTKQQSIPLVEGLGKTLGQLVVTKKWIPGLLTNWTTLKKRLQFYRDLRRSFVTGDIEKYTKKEQTQLRKDLAKLDAALAGVADMEGLPDAIFVVDAVRDIVAVREAKKIGIPVYGICDSNADPDLFDALIPANDDATRSIEIILKTIESSMLEGVGKKAPAEKKELAPAA